MLKFSSEGTNGNLLLGKDQARRRGKLKGNSACSERIKSEKEESLKVKELATALGEAKELMEDGC